MTKALIKILLIEDSLADVVLLQESIKDDLLADFQITVADRLKQGLVELGQGIFDILLLDLGLPDSQGLETLKTAHAKFPNIPIIVLSGMTDELFAQQAVQAGAQDYLVKSEAGWNSGPRAIRYAIERHQSQLAMRASEARFSTIFLSSPNATAITRLSDNRLLEVNEAWTQTTGHSSAEVIGRVLGEFDLWVSPEAREQAIRILREKGSVRGFEFQMRSKSGEIADMLFSAELIELGGEPCMLSMALDITERKKAEWTLKENTAKLKEAERNAHLGYYDIDTLSGKTIWSDETYRIFGLKPSEYDPNVSDYSQYIHDDDAKKLQDLYDECVKERKPFDLIYRIVHPGGEIRHVHSKSIFIADEQNNLTRLFGTIQDVTERLQAEEALKDSEGKFRTFIEQSTDGLAIFDEQGLVIEWNQAQEQITKLPKSQAIGKSVWDIQSLLAPTENHPPQKFEYFKNSMTEALQSGQSPYFGQVYETEVRTDFGEKKFVQQISFPIRSEKGYRIGAIVRDITERRLAEEKLRESEEQSRLAHDAAELGIWHEDFTAHTFHFDERARTHYDVDEFQPSVELISSRVHPDDTPQIQAGIRTVINPDTNGRLAIEYRVIHRDGSIHWLAVHVRIHFEERDGKRVAIFAAGTSQDITARKDAEQKLIQRTQQLRLINESTRKLNASLKTQHVYDVIYSSISQLMPCDTLLVSSFNPASKMITLASGWHDGQPLDLSRYEPIPLEPEGSGTQSQVIRSKEALLVPDFQARLKNTQVVHNFDDKGNPEDTPPEDADIPRSALVVPLLIEGEVLGVIQVFSYRLNAYTEDDLEILNGFSSQAAISLSNARLYEHIQQENLERKRAEEALQKSESKYRLLFDEMLSGVAVHEIICDPQGKPIDYRFTAINAAFEKMTGLISTAVIGKTVLEVMPATESAWIERYGQVALTRIPAQFESYSVELGKYFEVRAFSPEQGKFATVFNDITERKQAEVALRKSEALYRQAIEVAGAVPYLQSYTGSGNDFEYDFIGEGIRQITGYEAGEFNAALLDSLVQESILLDDLAGYSMKDAVQRVRSGEIPLWKCEHRIRARDGKIHWMFEAAVELYAENGIAKGSIGMFQDITGRKQAEEELRGAHKFLQSVQDALSSHISILDSEGNIVHVNSAWRNFGAQNGLEHPNHCIGMNYLDICESAKDVSAEAVITANAIREVLLGEEKEAWIEYPCDSFDERRWFVARITGFENNGQRWIVVSHENITPRKKVEEALAESEKRFRSIFETSGMGIFESTVNGHLININSTYARMFGFETPQHALQNITTIAESIYVHPQKRAQFINYVLEHPGMASFENEYRRRDGTTFIGELKLQVMRSAENQNAYIFGYVEDITERKQTEEGIHQRIKALELLYENSMAVNQSLNPKEIAQKVIELLGEKLDWHHTAIRLFNEQDNSLELVAFDLQGIQQEDEGESLARLSKVITHIGEGLSGWALQQSKTLRIGDVASNPHYVASYPDIHSGLYAPLKSGDHILGVISIESEKPDAFSEADEQLIITLANQAAVALENARLYREIRRYAEDLERRVQERTAEIEATRQRLELAVKTAGIGIWELDVRQNKDYWDDRLFALYGLSKETTISAPETWHKTVHPDDLAQQLKLMDEALLHKQPYNTEFRVIWPDESIHHIKSTGIVIYNETGIPERMIGANQDITIHKLAEETLSLANAEMERGLRMKNEFLANMSHELRTPLNAILGISESLEEQISGALNEKQLKYIRIISESGHHLLDMINDILDLSKIEAGKLDLEMHPVSVEKLCISSVRIIKELAQKKSLDVSFKMDDTVKVILGDERRLKQSLVNLLGNAVKFTPQGKKIGLQVSGNPATNEVTFTVWDEGIGISQENMQRLFKPFIQLNASLTREYAGTGLGLALVAQMVRLHGGHINLTSKLNVGSQFMITLPWMPEEQGRQSTVKPQVPVSRSHSGGRRTGKILIVDDTDVVSQLLSEYLRHKGYETLIANNGREAVLLARQEHPQLILMDVMMPVMNGMDATRHIRADAVLKNIPIIGLTALAMSSDRDQCLEAGMNDHISKPIQMQELLQKIEHYLPQTS